MPPAPELASPTALLPHISKSYAGARTGPQKCWSESCAARSCHARTARAPQQRWISQGTLAVFWRAACGVRPLGVPSSFVLVRQGIVITTGRLA